MNAFLSPTGSGDRLTEWLFATMMVGWGTYLLLPVETFAAPQYALLAAIAPENVWGAWSIGIGAVRMTALWINGSWRRTPAIRVACSILGVMWWTTMLYLLISAPEQHIPAGIVFYALFVGFELISCWRGAVDGFFTGAFRRGRGVF